jgi:hypothetical protein
MAYFDAPTFAGYSASNDVDQSNNFAQNALAVAVGSVVDFGTSFYNSVNFGLDDVSTYDALNSMGMDTMASGYLQNKGLINTISFVGGLFVPGMAAIKLSKMARSGLKGTNMLSPQHQQQNFAKLAELTAQGKKQTSEFRKLQHATMYKGVAQGLVDNAAVELAIVGSMNAHPFMEDYMDDFGQNFATSLLIGSGISSVIDLAATGYQVKKVVGAVETRAQQEVLGAVPSRSLVTDGVVNYLESMKTVKEMDNLINNNVINEATRTIAQRTRDTMIVRADQDLQSALKGKLKEDMTGSNEMAEHLRKIFDNEGMLGVGNASYFKPSPLGGVQRTPFTARVTELITPIKEKIKGTDQEVDKLIVKSAYVPREGIMVTPAEANRLAGAADSFTESQIKAMAKSISPFQLDDVGLDILEELATNLEGKYLAKLEGYDKMDLTHGAKLAIHESDLMSLQGVRARVIKDKARLDTLKTQLPELQQTVDTAAKGSKELKAAKSALTKTNNQIKNIEDTAEKLQVRVVSDADRLFNTQVLTAKVQKSTGIKPTHLQDIDNISKSATHMRNWEGLSAEAQDAMAQWVRGAGGERTMRVAIAQYRRAPTSAPAWVKEIMEHPERQRQLDTLKAQADSEGNIYLRRGTKAKPNGHFEAESYTTTPRIAAKFAGRAGHDYAYKIKVDDVVGYIHGIDESEWVVMSPTRETARDTSKFQRLVTNDADNTLATQLPVVTVDNVIQHTDDATRQMAIKLGKLGRSPEEIARRTNLENETVEALLGAHGSTNIPLRYHYGQAGKLADYLSPTQRVLSLSDNGRLTSYGEYVHLIKQHADQAILDKWNIETTISLLQTSKSAIAKDLMADFGLGAGNAHGRSDFLNLYDSLKNQLGQISDALAGNRLLQSSDMYSRMMGDAGLIVNKFGEQSARVANSAIDRMIGPANQYLSSMVQNTSELLAHNVVVQAVRSSGKVLRLDENFRLMEVTGTQVVNKQVVEVLKPLSYLGKEVAIPEHMGSLRNLFRQYENIGKELQQMRTTQAKILGAVEPSDKGLWLPNFDPRSKFVGFIRTTELDEAGQATIGNRIVTGNTLEELNEKRGLLVNRYSGTDTKVDFIWPKERNLRQSTDYDRLKHEAMKGKLQLADLGQTKKGAGAEELPAATLEEARNLLHGYSASIFAHTRDMQGMLMDDVVRRLDILRDASRQASDDQAMTPITKFLKSQVDAASVMKATLLGSKDLLDSYVPARAMNDAFSNAVDTGISTINKIRNTIATEVAPSAKVSAKWEKVQQEFETAGLPYPYRELDPPYIEKQFGTEAASGDARRLVSVGNAFASTMALRFMEIAHPLVNLLSMPILTQSAIGASTNSLMGHTAKALDGTGMFDTTRHMYTGVRNAFNPPPAMIPLMRRAEETGVFKAIVSEATDVIKLTRLRDRGAIARAEKVVEKIDGALGGKLVAASDWSETLGRKTAFGTGVNIAMERFGLRLGMDDDKIFLFARDFTDRSIGNYAAHQRPVMFHGTLGAAAGLFQTYMVTMAQNIYKNLETRDFATIARTMAWQGSIFGLSSLPGYDQMSTYIGESVNKDHTDLTTGAYKKLDDGMANVMLYGLPSNIGSLWGDTQVGPSLSTRGAVDPRFGIPAAQMVYDAGASIATVASRMGVAGDFDAWRGMREALSIQSISRPIARMSELSLSHSITSQGRTVSTPEEVWTPIGVASRLMGTRTTEEWKLRSAMHLNTYYGSVDRDNRKVAMEDVRTQLRAGSLNDSTITSAFDRYLEKGGTPSGFRSALNNALQFENQSIRARLFDDLKPDSPILDMIDNM